MNISINGKIISIDAGVSLERLLKDNGFDPAGTVVAVNGNIVSREDCSEIMLKEQDVLEVMSFVGGG